MPRDPDAPERAPDDVDEGRRTLARVLGALGGGALLSTLGASEEAAAQGLAQAAPRLGPVRVVDSLAELRRPLAPLAPGEERAAYALGSAAPRDGGHGLFVWVRFGGDARRLDDGGIQIVPAPAADGGAPGGYWLRVYTGAVNLRWFALARRDHDWTPALRAAVRAAVRARPNDDMGAGGAVHLPAGNYVVTGTVEVPKSGVHLRGDGRLATNLVFQPGAPGVHVLFDLVARDARRDADPATGLYAALENPGRIASASVRHMSFSSSPHDPATKVAIRVQDGDNVIVDDVQIGPWWTTGGAEWRHVDPPAALPNPAQVPLPASVGVELLGGQACVVSNLYAYADAPIRVGPAAINRGAPPATGFACDHLRLNNVHVAPHPSEAGIRILPGVVVSNLLLDGENSISGGSYGIHWDRGGASPQVGSGPDAVVRHANVALHNLRIETLVGHHDARALPPHAARRASIYLTASGAHRPLLNLSLTNVWMAVAFQGTGAGADPNGLFLRRVDYVTLTSCSFPSSHPATRHLDFDDTCSEVDWRNCYFGAQGVAAYDPASASFTGLHQGPTTPHAAAAARLIPSSATYTRAPSAQPAERSAFGAWVVRYRGVVGVGDAHAFPLLALAGWTRKFGQISLVARACAGDALEGGAWVFSRARVEPLHHTPGAASGPTVPDGRIGIAASGEYDFKLVNRLAAPMDFTVTIEFRAVSEAVDPATGRRYEMP